MTNCQSPQFCSQIPPRGGHVGRLVHRFLPSIRALGARTRTKSKSKSKQKSDPPAAGFTKVRFSGPKSKVRFRVGLRSPSPNQSPIRVGLRSPSPSPSPIRDGLRTPSPTTSPISTRTSKSKSALRLATWRLLCMCVLFFCREVVWNGRGMAVGGWSWSWNGRGASHCDRSWCCSSSSCSGSCSRS
jgi:hypothetical protein